MKSYEEILKQHPETRTATHSVSVQTEGLVTKESLREATDPVGQAVFQLLEEGEWIDGRGTIHKPN